MWRRWARAGLLGATLWSASGLAQAQCTKDLDCKGDRICEEGQCTAPSAAPAPVPAAPDAEPKAAAEPAPAAVSLPIYQPPTEQRLERRSRGAMAGGIVMVSVGTLLLLLGAVAHSEETGCPSGGAASDVAYSCSDRTELSTYALLFGGAGLIAGGVPLIIYGAKRVPAEPVARASLVPWLTPGSAGLRLRLVL